MWGPEFKPFWDHWAINPWLGGVKNGPFWTKNGQTWQACQRSKVVQKGPKGSKMVNLSVFDHLGPFWAHLDPFGPFQTKMNFLPQMGVAEVLGQLKIRQTDEPTNGHGVSRSWMRMLRIGSPLFPKYKWKFVTSLFMEWYLEGFLKFLWVVVLGLWLIVLLAATAALYAMMVYDEGHFSDFEIY